MSFKLTTFALPLDDLLNELLNNLSVCTSYFEALVLALFSKTFNLSQKWINKQIYSTKSTFFPPKMDEQTILSISAKL